MTLANLKKQYEHLVSLTKGNVKTGNSVRDLLIVSDAERTLKKFLKKFPELEVKEEVKVEIKSKEKK